MVVSMVLDQNFDPICSELRPGNAASVRDLYPVRRGWRGDCSPLGMDNFLRHGVVDEHAVPGGLLANVSPKGV
jgi:hypothetical protein